jgi:hypothetical protein
VQSLAVLILPYLREQDVFARAYAQGSFGALRLRQSGALFFNWVRFFRA